MNKRQMKKRKELNLMDAASMCLAVALQTMNHPLYTLYTGEEEGYTETSRRFFKAVACGDRLEANDAIWDIAEDIWRVIDSDDILMYPQPSRKFENFLNRAAMRRILRRNKRLAGDGLTLGELRNLFPEV